MKPLFLISMTLLMLAGCTSIQRQKIANNEDFVIFQAGNGDSFESLAEEFLGGKQYAEVIQRYNPETSIKLGSFVAIPKRAINPSSVYIDGYQHIPILCYHQFTEEAKSNRKMVVTRAEFENQMDYLASNGYQVLSLRELEKFLNGQKEFPIKSVVITIDDGYRSYLKVAYPILKKFNFPSTMFVYPEFIGAGRALKWKDVKYLSEAPLVDIQSHSKTHDSLSPKPSGESQQDYLSRLKVEVEGAEKILSSKTGKTISHFAYPYGNSSVEIVDLLEQNDYQIAVTVHKGSNPSFSAPLLLHRTMIYGGDTLDTFKKSLDTFSKAALND